MAHAADSTVEEVTRRVKRWLASDITLDGCGLARNGKKIRKVKGNRELEPCTAG
jgi:hypothetical protein